MRTLRSLMLSGALFLTAGTLFTFAAPPPGQAEQRQAAEKLQIDGNFKDAYDIFRKLALDPQDDPERVNGDFQRAIECLKRLDRANEIDEFRESVIAVHGTNWQLILAAAESYLDGQTYGYIVAGKFVRGSHRGSGEYASATERDRVRAIQLALKAIELVRDKDKNLVPWKSSVYRTLADAIYREGHRPAWKLQALTDLATLPDYEPGYSYWQEPVGAPVDAAGKPVYYQVSKTFESAKNDGERWRWALAQVAEHGQQDHAQWTWARFLRSQFGPETLGYGYRPYASADGDEDESGVYALHTLKDDETIARLAIGIKRFTLPDEFNYLKLYRQLAEAKEGPYRLSAVDELAEIYENRRQFSRAAEYWKLGDELSSNENRKRRLAQIVDNWGRFEPGTTQPAGSKAQLLFRYRNGKQVHFEARAVKIDELLADVKAYLKTRPMPLDSDKANIEDIGHRLVEKNETKYLGDQVAAWDLELEPREGHFDRRVAIDTPLEKAGAYLVTAKMQDGNTSRIIVWLADTVIVKKPLVGKTYYFVADAVTGEPVAEANLEFFGFRVQYSDKGQPKLLDTKNFAETTDADGQAMVEEAGDRDEYQWMTIARSGDRLAYLGFRGMWFADLYEPSYQQVKAFTITDRPVYRPNQTVHFKFWMGEPSYGGTNQDAKQSSFADQEYQVIIHNPRGDKILERSYRTDAYGGADGELELSSDAVLGQYNIQVGGWGTTFRVEEYKKPEFEVKIESPDKPVTLGEKIKAKIEARYYFGAPVTEATVHYKVTRSASDEMWYPPMPWDWFYGPGYWWFAYDYDWYPGFRRWSCCGMPNPWWWRGRHEQPEVVIDAQMPIGEDGTIEIEIDTATAKELHGDDDHAYQITAEVTDQSRRTIVGTGTVQAAREPFKVFAWVDHGYFQVGDSVTARFHAQTLDRKPVEGTGKLRLLKITYDQDAQPIETEVQSWQLDTDARGDATQKLSASAAGQYRLSYELTDSAGHTIEGGYLFNVIGEGFDGAEFRFNHLELIPDKTEYAAGETVKLLINTDRVGSTVLLFLRPQNGSYLPPQLLRLSGKSTTYEIAVTPKDMPNFYVEAFTIADAKFHQQSKEIVVPPEDRVLNVEIEPSAEEYKPGEKAEIKVTVTDEHGKPFVGSTALAIYDKAVEYISGGSNVPDIKEFFWKWRRQHHPSADTSLALSFYNLLKSPETPMNDIGRFGGAIFTDGDMKDLDGADMMRRSGVAGYGLGGGGVIAGAMSESAVSNAPAAAAPMSHFDDAVDGPVALNMLGKKAESLERQDGQSDPLVEPTIRSEFADTALWVAALETNGDGVATVELDMPENLTTWKIRTWAMGRGTRVGESSDEIITTKNLIVRLQAPRFFVETDEVVLSANVHNYLDSAKTVRVALELDGSTLQLLDTGEWAEQPAEFTIEIPAGGETRVDWRVKAIAEGEATIRMKALSDEESDAVEMKFPVHVHGMAKTESFAGALGPQQTSGQFTFDIPAERREEDSRVEIRFSPSLAGAMVDALPYLVDYPYGCTEQTLNRFLPTVIVQKILLDTGIDLADVRKKQTNLNAQELGDARDRAKQWKVYDRNPVFDEKKVDRMVKAGLQALTEMQVSDGGWGWFSGYGEQSYPHTTAVVVHGLQVAQSNGVGVVPDVLARGVAWLVSYQREQLALLSVPEEEWNEKQHKTQVDSLDVFVYLVLVDADQPSSEMLKFIERDRAKLGVYALTQYGLALHKQGEQDKLAAVMRNLEQYLEQDDENQTAWLRMGDGNSWWYWHGNDIEAMGHYLKLLAKTDPNGEVASRLVKYLINNRKHASYWNSTRDTAIVIEALAEYLRATKQLTPELTVEIVVDGKTRKTVEITADNLFSFDNTLVLAAEELTAGRHTVELRKTGEGRLYYNGYVSNFTLEPFITKTGLEIKVDRKFYKLVRNDRQELVAGGRGQALGQRVEKYDRVEIPNLGSLTSGELVEVELTIDSKNDYEYLMFEDLKAAGFEPVDVRSGYNGNSLGAYMELRDDRTSFFVRSLARGQHSVSYRLRAEIPGKFSALPALGEAMYAPELKANSDEMKVEIED